MRDPLVELEVHRADDDAHAAAAEHALDAELARDSRTRLQHPYRLLLVEQVDHQIALAARARVAAAPLIMRKSAASWRRW